MDGCEGILDMWYADMASCIFNHFILESDACSLAGLCYEKSAMAKGYKVENNGLQIARFFLSQTSQDT